MAEQTYLLNNVEVKTTGRTAEKELVGRRHGNKVSILHEVTPLDQEQGSWKQWVNLEELFVIREKDLIQ